MQACDRILNRLLTAVLVCLLVGMVLSITAEIVLNAVVQPIASRWLLSLEPAAAGGPGGFWQAVVDFVARASAPVNTASQTLLVWLGILGSALAFRRRAHLGVDALVRLYPLPVQRWCDRAATLLVGLFALTVLVFGGTLVVVRAFSMGTRMPGLEALNHGWFYLVLVLAGVLHLLYCGWHLAHPVAPSGGESPAGESAKR